VGAGLETESRPRARARAVSGVLGEFIPVREISSIVEHIRSTPDNTLFNIDSSLCSAMIKAAESKQDLSQDEADVLMNSVLSSNEG
jgi:hypothetical protein